MLEYDFHTLSPIEFEALSRDLLQKELGITLESFSNGRDQGIDFRHSASGAKRSIIVQCKRYTTSFDKLFRQLKNDELPKIKALNPKRYILTTSLSLSPNQKDQIKTLLEPYVKNNSDVYGREDINNLLSKYKDIEIQHYKLWLSSTNVLEAILHTDTRNRSLFEEEEIRKVISLFVENESYKHALDLFQQNHFAIISGDPGVGKTTLARMVIYRLLADEQFDEFIYIARDIEEALSVYDVNKKQLFFFDDFLGKNYFENGFARNEDTELIRFIERISASNNKGLILTTREYVLKQAQQQYKSIDSKVVTDSKYIIELDKYTKTIKAQILYNHLFSYGVPQDHLLAFLEDQTYTYLVSHGNYSPRLIETVLRDKPWERTSPEEFPDALKAYFDEPNKLWEDAYTNGISDNARRLLKILFTLKVPTPTSELYKAFDSSTRDLAERPDYHIFESAVKELENTFIDTTHHAQKQPVIDYKNPSIFDFLIDYFSDGRANDLLPAIQYPAFVDQIALRFTREDNPQQAGRIPATPEIISCVSNIVSSGFDKLPFSGGEYTTGSSYMFGSRNVSTYPEVLRILLKDIGLQEDTKLHAEIRNSYIELITSNSPGHFDAEMYLLDYFSSDMSEADIKLALHSIEDAIESMDDYELYTLGINEKLATFFETWLEENSDRLGELAKSIILEDILELDIEQLEAYEGTIQYYKDSLGIEYGEIDDAYADALYEAAQGEPPEYDYRDLETGPSRPVQVAESEDTVIKNMFDSLK